MLRCSLRSLQRAALQWQQACSASAGIAAAQGEALPSLAAALQRLALPQEPSWAAGGSRGFSAAAGGGGGGEQTPTAAGDGSAQPPAAPQDSSSTAPFASESGRLEFQDYEEALEAWGKAMDDGDWDAAWDIFEGVAPVEDGSFPSLESLLAWDPDAEQKERRREHEARIKEMHAARWVRRVDPTTGRSHGVGKRKTSVALVWLKEGSGHMMINKRPYDAYFKDLPRRNDLLAPFLATDTLGCFDVMVRVRGGGHTGQSQAIRHGLARALQNWAPELRPALKAEGLLTRDSRIVERKKPGLKKARKAFQWVKR